MLKIRLMTLFRIGLFAALFLLVAIFLIKLNDWSGDFRGSLLAAGNYEFVIYLLLFVFAMGHLLRWLLKKQFHNDFVEPKRRR